MPGDGVERIVGITVKNIILFGCPVQVDPAVFVEDPQPGVIPQVEVLTGNLSQSGVDLHHIDGSSGEELEVKHGERVGSTAKHKGIFETGVEIFGSQVKEGILEGRFLVPEDHARASVLVDLHVAGRFACVIIGFVINQHPAVFCVGVGQQVRRPFIGNPSVNTRYSYHQECRKHRELSRTDECKPRHDQQDHYEQVQHLVGTHEGYEQEPRSKGAGNAANGGDGIHVPHRGARCYQAFDLQPYGIGGYHPQEYTGRAEEYDRADHRLHLQSGDHTREPGQEIVLAPVVEQDQQRCRKDDQSQYL